MQGDSQSEAYCRFADGPWRDVPRHAATEHAIDDPYELPTAGKKLPRGAPRTATSAALYDFVDEIGDQQRRSHDRPASQAAYRFRVKPGLPPWGPHVCFRRVHTLVERVVRWSSCAILLSVTKRKKAQQAEPLSINVLCVQCSLGNRITLPSTHSSISGSGKSVNSMCFENTTLPLPSSQERVAVELMTTNFHD